jgi:FtsZ-binding cell division protein ZapB
MEEELIKTLRDFTNDIIASQPARRKPEHKLLTERYTELVTIVEARFNDLKEKEDQETIKELEATIADLERQLEDLETEKQEAEEHADELDCQNSKLQFRQAYWQAGEDSEVNQRFTERLEACGKGHGEATCKSRRIG